MTTLLTALERPDRWERTVTVAGERQTFGELRSAAAAVAHRLTDHGVTRLAVLAEPSLATVVTVVGALLARVPVVPVPKDAGAAEIGHVVRDAAVDGWSGPSRAGVDVPVLPVDLRARADWQAPPPLDDSPAMIIYTSGTTGLPKGVPVATAAIAAGVDGLAQAWAWSDADTLAHGLPLFHIHGLVIGCLGALRIGSSLVHTGRPTPEGYAAAGASLYFGVPTVWGRIAADETAARRLCGARLLVSGSAALPVPVFERMRALTGHEMVERYGMTETLLTLANRVDRPRLPGHVGWPIAGVSTRIRDDAGGPVPADGETVGRLEVTGRTVFSGYLGRPQATAEAFTEDGWFVTGDVATVDGDGNHRIVGRESVDLIKSGGYRIGAGEIETVLLGEPGVEEVAVVGAPDADLGQRVVAFVVARAGERPAVEALVAAVVAQLSAHKRPREVHFVDALPRNEMGKVQKALLLRP